MYPDSPRAFLRMQTDNGRFLDYALPSAPGERFLIGRDEDANMRFDGEDTTFLSEKHCHIELDADGHYVIADGVPGGTPSIVGTQVNGDPVGMSLPRKLESGDQIMLGSGAMAVRLQFLTGAPQYGAPVARAAAPPAYQPGPSAPGPGGSPQPRSPYDPPPQGLPYNMPPGPGGAPYGYRPVPLVTLEDGRSLMLGGIGARFGAYFIDLLITGVVGTVLMMLTSSIPTASDYATQQAYDAALNDWTFTASVVNFVIQSLYQTLFLFVQQGRTPGKALAGLRVVKLDGTPLSIGDAALRGALGYFLSSLVLYAGFFWALIDRQRRGWHDMIARTVVVSEPGRG